MADKDKKQAELTPWQVHHAAFEKQKAAEAAKLVREERRKKHSAKVESVVEKYEADPIPTDELPLKQPLLARFKLKLSRESKARTPLEVVLVKIWPFILVAVVTLLGSSYVISPLSKIGSFTTIGNVHETTKQIAAATGIKINDHVWQIINTKSALSSKVIKAFPRVKTADISWQFPNHFVAKITEYGESLYLKTGETYQLVLSDGTILTNQAVDAQKLAPLPVLDGFTAAEVKDFVKGYETLKPELKAQMTTVTKVPTKVTKDFIAIAMKDGHQVRVPLSQMALKLPYYPSVAASLTEPSVVDMEAGIYAKSKTAYQQDLDDEAAKASKTNQEATANQPEASAAQSSE
jgi:cell division protein FtsQ